MVTIKEGIHWVGAVDWNIRNFHGYITHHGTTYNSYLILDEKVALVDFVKSSFADEQLARIREVIDPAKIDYIIANHAEPDHSGSIRAITAAAPNAEILATERCVGTLQKYYGSDLKITPIDKKPTLRLGKRTLSFVPVPMAHWPDSMVTYVPEERLLLSNDAFGQHYASSMRFDDEVDEGELWREATAYYANILMPLWRSVIRALKALEGVQIDMIAPSHGIVWRKGVASIVDRYRKWSAGETQQRAVVVYDTMWGSTEALALALVEGLASRGVETRLHRLYASHNSDAITDILDAKAVLVGSPTLNNHLFPTVAGFLAYMRGLKPLNKIGAAFGSYGWAGGAKKAVEAEMQAAGIQLLESDLDFSYRPGPEELRKAYDFGAMVGEKIRSG